MGTHYLSRAFNILKNPEDSAYLKGELVSNGKIGAEPYGGGGGYRENITRPKFHRIFLRNGWVSALIFGESIAQTTIQTCDTLIWNLFVLLTSPCGYLMAKK